MNQLQNHFEKIADNLAERGFSVTDGFLSEQEMSAVRALPVIAGNIAELKKAGIGKESKQVNEGIRGDYISWIDPVSAPEPIREYLARITELRLFLNQSLFLGLKDFEVHIARYPIGAFYKKHLDQFHKDDHRRLSVICYLNEEWKEQDGGQLRIYEENSSIDILPVAGKLVCFRSELLEHEVLPAYRERVSITGWMLDQISDLRHL
ncbi:MAG: 2OG-Fe(II) oxygenase [Cyclobacteriaceae bacterium]